MKRLTIFFLLSFVALISFADGEVTDVPMSDDPGNGHDRNELLCPVVTYSSSDNELMVAFEANESYTLQIKDAAGATQYTSPIVTDGNEYAYPVNLSPHSYYLITIYSNNHTFTGVLFTP